MSRDVLQYDAVIVGAGPAGLACAIRLKQLQPDINLCVLEKRATVGAHSLSGAVIEPGPLDALLPERRKHPPGICVPAADANGQHSPADTAANEKSWQSDCVIGAADGVAGTAGGEPRRPCVCG